MSYQLYKPLRNHLRNYSLIQSLQAIWAYIQHLQFRQNIPAYIEFDADVLLSKNRMSMLVEWDLAVLAKELILNAPFTAKEDFRSWNALSTSINKLKELDNNISKDMIYGKVIEEKILLHVYRILINSSTGSAGQTTARWPGTSRFLHTLS